MPAQIASKVIAGARPEFVPRGELPGPDTAVFVGLDAYLQLVRCVLAKVDVRGIMPMIVPASLAISIGAVCTVCPAGSAGRRTRPLGPPCQMSSRG